MSFRVACLSSCLSLVAVLGSSRVLAPWPLCCCLSSRPPPFRSDPRMFPLLAPDGSLSLLRCPRSRSFASVSFGPVVFRYPASGSVAFVLLSVLPSSFPPALIPPHVFPPSRSRLSVPWLPLPPFSALCLLCSSRSRVPLPFPFASH